jgi:ABC-type polysaccharide/polyol phosphate export permease
MSAANVASSAASADGAARPAVLRTPAIVRLAGGTVATAQAELRKMRHDPFDIFTRAAQPLLWLFIFGTVIVLGKATGAGTRSLVQAVLLLAVVAIAGIGLRWNVLGVLGALVLLALATAGFACLSMLLAAGLRTRERFMGIGQLITMPLFFASSALHPPGDHARLAARDRAREPLTYKVLGMRRCLLGLPEGGPLWVDFAVVVAFLVVTAAAATRAYPRAVL